MLSIKTILHPTDFSEQSEAAFRCAFALASDYKAQLVIVHVVCVPSMCGDWLRFSNSLECQVKPKEELFKPDVSDECVEMVRPMEHGKPAAEILHLAQLCQADLIVMGTHGRRGLKYYFMGSVADEIVRLAPCPVVTVRVPKIQRVSHFESHADSSV